LTDRRRYDSPKREAQTAATREAILQAFSDQLSQPDRATLSPSEAARQAGVSVRTVHMHFPTADDQMIALAEWFDRRKFYPEGLSAANGPEDLARYFFDVHQGALTSPVARALATASSPIWREVRARRRAERLEAVRGAVAAIGAPRRATEEATATLLAMSGAEFCWTMHDYGLPIDRIPDVIAATVKLVVDDLKAVGSSAARSAAGTRPPNGPRLRSAPVRELDDQPSGDATRTR
jgi:AcrR family transcriptional regulator